MKTAPTLTDAVLAATCYFLLRVIKRADYQPAVRLKGCQNIGPIAFPRRPTERPLILMNCMGYDAFMDDLRHYEEDLGR